MSGLVITEAETSQTKLRCALDGVSGSGKTFSAIKMAKGLVKYDDKRKPDKLQICVIDTENKTATLERKKKGMPRFGHIDLQAPFTVSRYLEALTLAEQQGYEVIVIDTGTKVWNGSGGLLESKTKLQERGVNEYAAWNKVDAQYRKLMERLQQSPAHIIITFRSKNKLVLEKDDADGKTKVVKKNLEAEMRQGAEFEFDLTFTIDRASHLAEVKQGKDRLSLFEDREPFLIDEKTGEEIRDWFGDVKPKEAKVIAESKGPEPEVTDEGKQAEAKPTPPAAAAKPAAEKKEEKVAPPEGSGPNGASMPPAKETGEAITVAERNTIVAAAKKAGVKTPKEFKNACGQDLDSITKAQFPHIIKILEGLAKAA